jgi:hypothetical protein
MSQIDRIDRKPQGESRQSGTMLLRLLGRGRDHAGVGRIAALRDDRCHAFRVPFGVSAQRHLPPSSEFIPAGEIWAPSLSALIAFGLANLLVGAPIVYTLFLHVSIRLLPKPPLGTSPALPKDPAHVT